MRKIMAPPHSLSPAPVPVPQPAGCFSDNFDALGSFLPDSTLIPKSAIDLAILSLTAALLLLSLVAFAFVLHLRLKSRRAQHLQNFNSLWIVRLLLVLLASMWAFNEILRQPFVRTNHGDPVLLSTAIHQQENVCRVHLVLSLGLFEPGFLVSLLFLVNASIKKNNSSGIRSLVSVLAVCAPIIFLQSFFVLFPPFEARLPKFIHRSSIITTDVFGDKTVLCTYPFYSWVIFIVFAVIYAVAFLLSCWRVTSFVINKGIRHRIYVLASTVVVALSVQIVSLSLSWLWVPEEVNYAWVMLAVFLCVALCMAVAEALLVIKPIKDALDVCRWSSNGGSRRFSRGD